MSRKDSLRVAEDFYSELLTLIEAMQVVPNLGKRATQSLEELHENLVATYQQFISFLRETIERKLKDLRKQEHKIENDELAEQFSERTKKVDVPTVLMFYRNTINDLNKIISKLPKSKKTKGSLDTFEEIAAKLTTDLEKAESNPQENRIAAEINTFVQRELTEYFSREGITSELDKKSLQEFIQFSVTELREKIGPVIGLTFTQMSKNSPPSNSPPSKIKSLFPRKSRSKTESEVIVKKVRSRSEAQKSLAAVLTGSEFSDTPASPRSSHKNKEKQPSSPREKRGGLERRTLSQAEQMRFFSTSKRGVHTFSAEPLRQLLDALKVLKVSPEDLTGKRLLELLPDIRATSKLTKEELLPLLQTLGIDIESLQKEEASKSPRKPSRPLPLIPVSARLEESPSPASCSRKI